MHLGRDAPCRGPAHHAAQRVHDVPRLEDPGADLRQERREEREVLVVHEPDLDVAATAEATLERLRGRDACEAPAEDEDAVSGRRLGVDRAHRFDDRRPRASVCTMGADGPDARDLRPVQAAAPGHRSGRDAGVGRLARRGRAAGRPGPRPLPPLPPPEARAPAAGRAAEPRPDALHQHDQPGAGALLPRRRGDGAPDAAPHPLERAGDGAAREHALRGHRRPPLDVCQRGKPLRGGLQPLLPRQRRRRPATRSSSRAMRRPASTRAPSSRAGSPRSSSTTSAARRCWPGGLSSYPHPRLMPDFWQFPTVSAWASAR